MKTKKYSPSFSKTLGYGINAVVNGKKDFYILEHLVGSHYHQSGEKQKIMLDEVVLGRESDCHVRFDESFSTVSRHHASIVRDGDNWKLVHLSHTNTTFLNGVAIQDSWYLQSGDEIQLAVNGPKLVFRIPTDKSGMNFTQRLDAFRDQVIRPYKTAFIAICIVISLIVAGCIWGGIVINEQNEQLKIREQQIEEQQKQIEEQQKQIGALYDQLMETNEALSNAAMRCESAQKEAIEAKRLAFKEEAERIKSQKDLNEVQRQLQQLNTQMNSFYDSIIYGE